MKKTKSFLLLFTLTPLLMFWGCELEEEEDNPNPYTGVGSHSGTLDRIASAMDSVYDEFQLAGMVVGLDFADDGHRWIKPIGKANLGFDVNMEWDDRFKAGSISKTYIATVVLILVDEGLISLDNPCQDYLPDDYAAIITELMQQYPDTIMTVRALLNHTAGLINYNHTDWFNMVHMNNPFKTWTTMELVSLARDSLTHRPGTRWNYSSTGFIYLQIMVEHLTGNSLKDEVHTRVFDALGLAQTEYCEITNTKDMVDGYWDFDGNGKLDTWNVVTGASPTIAMAAGAIVSNAPDMLNWIDELATGEQLLSAATQAERLKTVSLLPYAPISFGLGIVDEDIVTGDGKHVWGHIGGIDGFTAALFRDQLGNDIVVLVNAATPVPEHAGANVAHEMMFAIRDILGGDQVSAAKSITDSEFISAYNKDW